jgi:hypothetical protein
MNYTLCTVEEEYMTQLKTMTLWKLILVTTLTNLTFFAPPAISDEKLGDWFYSNGDYYRAITEYEKARFKSNDLNLSIKVAKSYYSGKEFDHVMDYLEQIEKSSPKIANAIRLEMLVLRTKTELRRDNYGLALEQIKLIDGQKLTKAIKEDLPLIKAYAYIFVHDHAGALEEIANIPKSSRRHKSAQALSTKLKKKPDLKNPNVAAALSIIPGLGQAVNGYYVEAAASFIFNGIIGYFAYDEWRKSKEIPNYGQGSFKAWMVLQLPFYTGNIYSSARLVKQENDRKYRDYYKDLESAGNYQDLVAP